MSTHTEDTKEMTAETRHMLIVSVRNWDDGTISFLDFEKNVEELLTTYASRVREERDREILAELNRLDGDTTEPIPTRKHNWYYGYADCLVEVKKFITTLTQKT